MQVIDWGDVKDRGEGKYLKWSGKNKVRICSPLLAYEHAWPTGVKTEHVVAVQDLDDGGKLKVASLKKTMLKVLKAFNEDGGPPHGPDAPYFIVHREGTGMDTKYSMIPGGGGKPHPITVDVAQLKAFCSDMTADAKKHQAKVDESKGDFLGDEGV